MPLSGGTSGAHDDSMHQGNAKRDIAGGVAALNGSGYLLVPGCQINYARDGANKIYVIERTSNEIVMFYRRLGAFTYEMLMHSGGVYSTVQLANMKDAASGIAALDAAGSLLLPGSKMYYTRDGSDDVHIYERTSNEEAYAFHRVGADDYTFFVKESNVWKRMQTESMKDVVNGIAGLDASALLPASLMDNLFLTPARFRTNAGTGTATNPANTNDNNTGTKTDFTITNSYVEVDLAGRRLVSEFRHYGNAGHVGDGTYKIQHLVDSTWVDNTLGIAVEGAGAWTAWTALATVVWTAGIRIVADNVDTGGSNMLHELEMK